MAHGDSCFSGPVFTLISGPTELVGIKPFSHSLRYGSTIGKSSHHGIVDTEFVLLRSVETSFQFRWPGYCSWGTLILSLCRVGAPGLCT